MATAALRPRYTLEEYLQLEEMSNVRHEYLDGQILAMAGGTPEHGRICANLITQLSLGVSLVSLDCEPPVASIDRDPLAAS